MSQEFRDQRITIAGLGHFGGGIAVAKWLVSQNAKVVVTDRAPATKLADALAQLDGLPIDFRLGGHDVRDFTSADLVVASPAIPPTNPYLQAARAAGVSITTEICLFVDRCRAPIVGVTGTKGKSTTSAMLGQILKRRYTTWFGGNIGKSLLDDLPRIQPDHIVVLELSSFMLHYLGERKWSPHVAVLTMLVPDHIEWHGSFEAYADAKLNIVRFQKQGDVAVVSEETADAVGRALPAGESADARVLPAGDSAAAPVLTASNVPARPSSNIRVFPDASASSGGQCLPYSPHLITYSLATRPFALLVPGQHNQLNAQAAFAAACILGVSWDDAQAALLDFNGLPHRIQLVHESAGVRWFNDSIATIPQAAAVALEAFEPRRVIHILGGSDKGLDITPMIDAVAKRAKAALCIGVTGPAVAKALRAAGATDVRISGDLATAVREAKSIAAPGDVVLLSTGFASYDQFANFEERGETFAKLAKE